MRRVLLGEAAALGRVGRGGVTLGRRAVLLTGAKLSCRLVLRLTVAGEGE